MTAPPPIGFHPDFLPSDNAYSGVYLSYGYPTAPPVQSVAPTEESTEEPVVGLLELDLICLNSGHSWQAYNVHQPFPIDVAVRAGRDTDGTVIYVGRAFHEGDMVPCKVMPEKQAAYISYNMEEVFVEDIELLRTGNFVWEFCTNGTVPEGAVECGRTVDGEKLYCGRALHQGSQTPGKVQGSHGCLYIAFGGEEVAVHEYEVLVIK